MQSLVCSCCSKRDGPYIAQAAEKLPRRCSYICRQNKWPCFKQKQMNTPAKKEEITAGWCHTLCTRNRHEQQTSPPHHPALLLYCHGPLTGSGRVPTRTNVRTPAAWLTSAGIISARKSRYPGTCRISTSTESVLPGNGSARSSHNIWRERNTQQRPTAVGH